MGIVMRKKAISVKKVAKRNPHVDLAKIREAYALLRELDRQGAEESRYNLVSPFDRRFSQERQARHELTLDLKSGN